MGLRRTAPRTHATARRVAWLVACLVPALPAPLAHADTCPGPEAMATSGIWIRYADGWTTHSTRTPRNTVLEMSFFDGTEGDIWVETWRGLYVIADGDAKNGVALRDGVITYAYATPLDRLPPPAEGLEREDVMTVEGADPGTPPTATQTVRVGQKARLTIGTCTYDTLVAHYIYDPGDGNGYTYSMNLIEGLEIAVLSASGVPGKFYDTFFKATSISTTPP